MSETATACTCRTELGHCSASPAAHVRGAAEFLVRMAGIYDDLVVDDGRKAAERDQAASVYRDAIAINGVDRFDRAQVAVYVVAAASNIATMTTLAPLGQYVAAATAKLIVMAVPLVAEMAHG